VLKPATTCKKLVIELLCEFESPIRLRGNKPAPLLLRQRENCDWE
jgi:hypothetical protein